MAPTWGATLSLPPAKAPVRRVVVMSTNFTSREPMTMVLVDVHATLFDVLSVSIPRFQANFEPFRH